MKKNKDKINVYILYKYNQFKNDFEQVFEYLTIEELTQKNNIKVNNAKSIYHYIYKSLDDKINRIYNDKYIIIRELIDKQEIE